MVSTTVLQAALEKEKRARLICAELNNFIELKPVLQTVISHIKEWSGCEAVSIRLRNDYDYPYFVYNGFSDSFILHENSLCHGAEENKRPSANDSGALDLECICGLVIKGELPPLSCFTPYGSFWCSDIEAVFSLLGKRKYFHKIRTYCITCGYKSKALIPIKLRDGEIIGLLQLNDKKLGAFSRELVLDLEMIAEHIGLAVKNSLTYTRHTTTDLLTEVLNRKGLFDAIGYLAPISQRNRSTVGVMMIDIDHFKRVNDRYGHQKGDNVLKKVAGIIKSNIRASDVLGRYGGEEFLLFMSPVEAESLPRLAEKIREKVEKETGPELPVTISVGVAKGVIENDTQQEIERLIRQADQSLYQAKKNGRNSSVVHSLQAA